MGFQISDGMGRGKAAGEAVASAVPQLVDHLALTLPRREQCEATVDSCSCADHELTFGEVLDDVLATRSEVHSAFPTGSHWVGVFCSRRYFLSVSGPDDCHILVQLSRAFLRSCSPRGSLVSIMAACLGQALHVAAWTLTLTCPHGIRATQAIS